MSVINQVLLDLEKRRASGEERSALPGHVRALPDDERTVHWSWYVAASVAAVAVLAIAWTLLSGSGWIAPRAAAPKASQPISNVAIERVVVATAGVSVDSKPAPESESPKEVPASRLSFDLSNPPAPVESTPAARSPLPTARVTGIAPADSPTAREGPAAPPERVEAAKPSAQVAKTQAGTPAPRSQQIQKEVRQPLPRDVADSEYRKATALLHQGRPAEAHESFQAALNAFPAHHGARQALVGLLLDSKKFSEAERVLQEGLAVAPAQSGFVMTLARLQVDRGEGAQAIATLRSGLDHAQGNADYLAFLAALLQRQGRHDEAIEQFQGALRMRPGAGVWWLGLGISLQAVHRGADAQDAYRRARATNSLNSELTAFAEQRLRQLQ